MYRGTTPTLTFRLPIDTGSTTVSGSRIYVRDGSGNMQPDGSYVSVSIYAAGTWKQGGVEL